MRAASAVTRRLLLAVSAIAAAGVAASGAQAATIHACVRPKSGATRIVGANAKCHHGEQKLSWSTEGPRGPAGSNGASGAPGAAGTNGTTGAGPLFSAVSGAQPHITEEGTLLVSKVVPPGSYMIWGKTDLLEASNKGEVESVGCALTSHPGTEETEEATLLDEGISEEELGDTGGGHFGAGVTIALQGAMTSTVTSTLLIDCSKESGSPVTITSVLAQLQALGVTTIS
jgi:hypothetical protein